MIPKTIHEKVIIRWLGSKDYLACWQAMKLFTDNRHAETLDEFWLLEHHPVFTQGQNGKPEHVLNSGSIPVIQTDRGGQVTYHGPGQLMVYTLIDVKRKKFTVRDLVTSLEQSVIDMLASDGIPAKANRAAPGVYIISDQLEQKICSIGLRIRRGCAYHGIAFNVSVDLTPFQQINPCGYTGLKMARLADFQASETITTSGRKLINYLMKNLGYTTADHIFDEHFGQVDGHQN